MPNFGNWLNASTARDWIDGGYRAQSVAELIAENPSSITIERENPTTQAVSNLSAQTVRIELRSLSYAERQVMGNNGLMTEQSVIVLGYRNHPTIADTNIRMGDRFTYDNQYYVVRKVEAAMSDRVLAFAEAMWRGNA